MARDTILASLQMAEGDAGTWRLEMIVQGVPIVILTVDAQDALAATAAIVKRLRKALEDG